MAESMKGFVRLKAAVYALLIIGAIVVMSSGCKERAMKERKGLVSMKGQPLTLLGNELKVGDVAPDCEVVGKDLKPVKLSSFKGKVCIISSLPSLDTSVCNIMTRKFNEDAAALGSDVVVLAISMDLPFAQDRWCVAADVQNVETFSDHRSGAFGEAFGVLIKDLRLLARSVFVLDREGIIRYIEIVEELSSEPDYEAALKAAKDLV